MVALLKEGSFDLLEGVELHGLADGVGVGWDEGFVG